MSTTYPEPHVPAWCEVGHEPDAPAESRYHQRVAAELTTVFGYQPDVTEEPYGEADALIVRRVRYFDSANDWIVLERAEQASTRLILRADAAVPLAHALLDACDVR